MKRKGWNPTRRNRNLGTENAGYGQDNRLVISERWNEYRRYWHVLRNPVHFERDGFLFLVEPCNDGFVHAVTVDDILLVLALLPHDDVAPIRIVALRQPTRKQRVLVSVSCTTSSSRDPFASGRTSPIATRESSTSACPSREDSPSTVSSTLPE